MSMMEEWIKGQTWSLVSTPLQIFCVSDNEGPHKGDGTRKEEIDLRSISKGELINPAQCLMDLGMSLEGAIITSSEISAEHIGVD